MDRRAAHCRCPATARGRITDERTSQRVADFADEIERLADLSATAPTRWSCWKRCATAPASAPASTSDSTPRADLSTAQRTATIYAPCSRSRAIAKIPAISRTGWHTIFQLTAATTATTATAHSGPGGSSWSRGVRLATVHRVKGLEWPHVIVLSAIEGLMPHRLASDTEEERRIFHVAMTRCSESVLIVADGQQACFVEGDEMASTDSPSRPRRRASRGPARQQPGQSPRYRQRVKRQEQPRRGPPAQPTARR